jgi:hypothetical protein
MTKREISALFEWLVDMKELIKTKEEIDHLTEYYYSTFKHINLDYLPDKRWKDLVQYWLEYKKEKRQNYKTEKSIKIFCKHLVELSQGNYDIAAAIIQKSTANNYAGIHPLTKNDLYNANLTANINQQANHNSTNEAIRILHEQG